jgi:hypothetical protein
MCNFLFCCCCCCCMQVDAEARLTADEALAHPWVQGLCFEPQRKGERWQQQQQCILFCGLQAVAW